MGVLAFRGPTGAAWFVWEAVSLCLQSIHAGLPSTCDVHAGGTLRVGLWWVWLTCHAVLVRRTPSWVLDVWAIWKMTEEHTRFRNVHTLLNIRVVLLKKPLRLFAWALLWSR